MKDDFINKALPNVSKGFADSLYKRISVSAPSVVEPKVQPKQRPIRLSSIAALVLGMILLVAWSEIRLQIRYVPIGDLWLVEYARVTQNAPGEALPTVFVPTPLPTLRIWHGTTIPEVKMFRLSFPSWIPKGFSLVESPPEMKSFESTLGIWRNNTKEEIRLFFVPRGGGMRPYAPPGMWKEVQISDQATVLVYGRLALTDPENPTKQRKWDQSLGLQLHWVVGENVYTLETFGSYLSERDLIQMAESMEQIPSWMTDSP